VEVNGANFLYAFAVMTITAGGFFALLLGIRQTASARLSLLEGYLAKTALTQLFTLTGGALLPPLFGTVRRLGIVALAHCRGVFWDPDVGSPIDLSPPTPKGGRNRSATSRLRGFCRFGECHNRRDADLRHRWL